MSTSCVQFLSHVPGSRTLVVSGSSPAEALPKVERQKRVAEVSRALYTEIQGYQEIMASLTPARVALLLWTDKALTAKAKAAGVGYDTPAEKVEDTELKGLLEARQAAYLTLVMAVHRWQDVLQLYDRLKELCVALYCKAEPFMWETGAVIGNGIFKQWEQWAEALNMVPSSAFYQNLYDTLPSYFQTTGDKVILARQIAHAQSSAKLCSKTKAT